MLLSTEPGSGVQLSDGQSYGSLQVTMPQQLQADIITGLQIRIRQEDLIELELEPHVTIRYGFADSVHPDDFLPILQDSSPIKLTLLEPDVFSHDDQDVLKLNIFSDCLRKLNEAVGVLPLPGETYTEYQPHLTLAYLRKGTGWKYVGDPRLDMLSGTEVVLDSVVYSDANREKTNIYLTGDPTKSIAGVSLLGNGYIDGRMPFGVRLSFCPGEYRVSSCGSGITVLKTNIGGTTGAKLVEREGQKYVAKQYSGNKDQVSNELAANKLYALLGDHAGAPKSELGVVEGKSAVLAEHIPDTKELGDLKGENRAAAHEKIQENFAVDALLANWDVVGTGADNVLVGKDGEVHRIDNGGALEYRAQGELKGKAFGTEVKEIDKMRDPKVSPDAAKVFKGVTDEQIAAQVSSISSKFSRGEVESTLKEAGYSPSKAGALAEKLEARLKDLQEKYPSKVGNAPKLAQLEKQAAAVKEKAAKERAAGGVSVGTKRERAEINKQLADAKAGKTSAAPKEAQGEFAKPAPGEYTVTSLGKGKESGEPVSIYTTNGGESLPKELTKQFGSNEYEDHYRFIYDIANNVFHTSSGSLNDVDHADFFHVTEDQKGVPDLLQVRGAYDPNNHEVTLYDMTKEAPEIAQFHSEVTGTKLGEKQAIQRIEAGLKKAEANMFRINGKKPKVTPVDINEILGFDYGVLLAAPSDVREAGDNLDLPLGDVSEELDLPEGVDQDEVEQAIQDALDHVTARGMNEENGTAYLESVLEKQGVAAPESYLSTLVNTHNDISEAAYSRKKTLADDDIWGYEYELGDSLVHREEHEALEGTILPKDDPFWDEWYPPNGWGCNCNARPITWEEAIDEGYADEDEEAPEGIGSPPEGFDSDFQDLLEEDSLDVSYPTVGFGVTLSLVHGDQERRRTGYVPVDSDYITLHAPSPVANYTRAWLKLAFCATGPGGGIDPHCGSGEHGGREAAKSSVAKLIEQKNAVKLRIKAVKAGKKDPEGKTLSQLKKLRADLNKQIDSGDKGKTKLSELDIKKIYAEREKIAEKQGDIEYKLEDKHDILPSDPKELKDGLSGKEGPEAQKLCEKYQKLEDRYQELGGQLKSGVKADKQSSEKIDSILEERGDVQKVIGDFKEDLTIKWYSGVEKPYEKYLSQLEKQNKLDDEDSYKGITDDYGRCCQTAAIDGYTDSSEYLNEQLRTGGKMDKETKEQLDWLDKAIDAAPALKKDVVVERGLDEMKEFAKLQPGDIIKDKGFMSTTFDSKISSQFDTGAKFQIRVPAGTKGLYLQVKGLSESEFLLPRGGRLQVAAVKKTEDHYTFQLDWVGQGV